MGVTSAAPSAAPSAFAAAAAAGASRASGQIRARKGWPTPLPPLAPLAGFVPVVDGSDAGLPDTPTRMMMRGRMNKSPSGKNLTVVFGTNKDEMASFMMLMGVIVPGVTLPLSNEAVQLVAEHLVDYHDGWTAHTVDQILAEYPSSEFATQSYRAVQMLTDVAFRCGQRKTASVLADAGIETFLHVHTILVWKQLFGRCLCVSRGCLK
jgi:hypothetical protein